MAGHDATRSRASTWRSASYCTLAMREGFFHIFPSEALSLASDCSHAMAGKGQEWLRGGILLPVIFDLLFHIPTFLTILFEYFGPDSDRLQHENLVLRCILRRMQIKASQCHVSCPSAEALTLDFFSLLPSH